MAITSNKLLNRPSELHRRYGGRLAMKEDLQKKMVGGGPTNIVLSKKSVKDIGDIKVNVIKIESILKGTLASEKKLLDEKKRQESGKGREKQEEKLETKPQAEKGPIKMPKVPRTGFLDWIKNFIGNVILGYFAVRLVDFLPKITPILKFLGSAADFVIDVGGKLLDGLVTFIDWGYKAYDATRGFAKNLFGDEGVKQFDQLSKLLNNFLNLALIAGMVAAGSGGRGGRGGGAAAGARPRPGRGGRVGSGSYGNSLGWERAKKGRYGDKGGYLGVDKDIRERYAKRYGRDAAIKKFGGVETLGGKYARSGAENLARKGLVSLTGKGGAKAVLKFTRPLLKRLPVIGALIDFGLSVALGENPGRAAFRAIGAGLLGAVGAAAGSVVPVAGNFIGGLLGGFAGDAIGGVLYDTFFGGKSLSKGKSTGKAGGGIARGGKRQTGARRTISKGKKGKYKRVVPRKPGEVEIKPGADVGGEDKIFGIFPNPLKAAKKVMDAINPFGTVKTAGEDLGKTDYFGPILTITSKITLGQKPSQRDYENVGLGINLLIARGIEEKQLKGGLVAAFAEGGLVDMDVLSAAETGGDISNWVAKTFQGEIESNAQKTLRLIRENADKKKTTTDENIDKTTTPNGIPLGEGETASGRALMQGLIQRGFNKEEAAAIVGNLWAESGFRTTATNPTSGAFGLMQWLGGRKSRLYSYAAEKGKQVTDVDLQLDYIKWELRGGNAYETEQFKKAMAYGPDVAAKTKGFAEQVERAGAGELRSSMSKRIGAAESVYGGKMVMGEKPSGISVSTSAATGPLGDRQKTAGELGSFIKSLGVAKGSGVHEHPQHGGVKGYHRGRGHYEGRAIDIGGWGGKYGKARLGSNFVDDQSAILAGINQFAAKTGKKPSLVLHGNNDAGHWDHVHAEYEEGGETLPYPHLAKVSEDGPEIVVDNDSAYSSPQTKNMLLAINQAKGYGGVMKAIQQYAPYDALSPQTIVLPQSPEMSDDYDSSMSGGTTLIASGGNDNPYEALYVGG